MQALGSRTLGWFAARGWSPLVAAAYLALVALFGWSVSQFYIPGKGFTYLIAFGAKTGDTRLTKLRKVEYHVERVSDGYDAQYYAQIAMDPSLQNTQLRHAVDSLPYRARRILLPAIAHVAGLGQPGAILQAYALLNIVAWLLLAVLLLHWFPPRTWDDFLRWGGVLFSFGLGMSVRKALPDGPSLLLVATGVFLLEKGWRGWATATFALGGLAKETSLLGAAALAPLPSRAGRDWALAALRLLLVLLPLALWLAYVQLRVDTISDPGSRNFALPLAAYFRKWQEVRAGLADVSWAELDAVWSLLALVALTVQGAFLVLRPQPANPWWRVGASYGVLLLVLGDAVWEGYPGAASRVLLPLQLAFNVLVPAGRGWRAVLLAGNLTVLAVFSVLEAPLSEGVILKGRTDLAHNASGQLVKVDYSDEWFPTEQHRGDFWCWAPGSAALTVQNPHAEPLAVRVRFLLNVSARRTVRLLINGTDVWSTSLGERDTGSIVLNTVVLQPGANRFEFVTDVPGARVGTDPRPLAFRITNLRLDLLRKVTGDAGR